MIMKIYVVRHGETNSNLAGIVSGRSDEELNENGIKQAQDINLKIADMKFADVYVSPMKRTIQTAEIVVPEYKYIIDDRLAERELGKLKGYSVEQLWDMPDWNSLENKRMPEGAETFGAGRERVAEFIADVKKKYKEDDILLIVTHSFISRCFWSISNDIDDPRAFENFKHKNETVKLYYI